MNHSKATKKRGSVRSYLLDVLTPKMVAENPVEKKPKTWWRHLRTFASIDLIGPSTATSLKLDPNLRVTIKRLAVWTDGFINPNVVEITKY